MPTKETMRIAAKIRQMDPDCSMTDFMYNYELFQERASDTGDALRDRYRPLGHTGQQSAALKKYGTQKGSALPMEFTVSHATNVTGKWNDEIKQLFCDYFLA